ncbi:Replicative DNA helicase [compost metagenome]
MSIMELHSIEAEHGVLGAMLIQPHLIDVLSEELPADAFAWNENADLYRLILALHGDGQPVDVITLSDRKPVLANDIRTLAYAGEIQANTVSVVNAKEYARIVRERAVARQIADVASRINDLAHEAGTVEDKVALAQSLILGLDAEGVGGECQMVGDLLEGYLDVLQERHDRTIRGDKFDGLGTGIPDLDKFTQGLKPGQMIVLAGRPAMGKTTLAMNIVADVAIKQGKPALVISLEMTKTQLLDRLLAAIGGIPLPAIKDGSCSHEYSTELASAALKLRDSPIAVTDVPVMTMPRIRAIARRQKHKMGGLGAIAIDYLGLVEGDGKGRVDDVTTMSRQVKLLAREMGCPVILLCQLNRGCESRPDKRPVLSDLRESGAIEQDADIVMFVYRDEVYFPNSERKGIGEVLIRKNRDGEIGTVFTAFQGDKSRFVPLAASDFSRPKTTEEDW